VHPVKDAASNTAARVSLPFTMSNIGRRDRAASAVLSARRGVYSAPSDPSTAFFTFFRSRFGDRKPEIETAESNRRRRGPNQAARHQLQTTGVTLITKYERSRKPRCANRRCKVASVCFGQENAYSGPLARAGTATASFSIRTARAAPRRDSCMDLPSPTDLAIPFFLLAVVWEWSEVRQGRIRGTYEAPDAATSLSMGVGNALVGVLTAGASLAIMEAALPFRVSVIEPGVASGLALFVLYDFLYYWKHRAMHRVRWFWCEHVTHHSSRRYNLTTALRQPWFGPFSGLILFGWPAVIAGFDPGFVAFVAGLNLLYQFWIHTESVDRMPAWFEAVMNTPSHHRVHHAVNPEYLDANYGGVFIVWDRMFGTFVREDRLDPPVYGLVTQLSSYNPIVVAYHELCALFRDMRSDGLRPTLWVKRLILPPGWSPDGRHRRTEDIKREWREGAASPGGANVPS